MPEQPPPGSPSHAAPDAVRNVITGGAFGTVQAGTIIGGVHVTGGPRPTPVPHQLPGGTSGFTNRADQLAALDALLTADPPVVVISGTAGVGKTALAVQWGRRVVSRLPDGQLYADLRGYSPDQPAEPTEVLIGFLHALGVDAGAIPAQAAQQAALYRTLTDGQRMLVVLDNAHTADQVRPLLPGSASCVVLVTSRDALAGLVARDGARRIDVDLLTTDEGCALLRSLVAAHADADPDATTTLARQCAGLPLALRIAAELADTYPTTALAELVAELHDLRERLDALDADGEAHTAVRSVFSWSYRHLPDEVAAAFRLLGLHVGSHIDTPAAAALLDRDLNATKRLLRALVRAHLVAEPTPGRYTVHDLLRGYAAELAADVDSTETRLSALRRLFGHHLAAADAADRVISPHRYRIPPDDRIPTAPARSFADYDSALSWLFTAQSNLTALCRLDIPELDAYRWRLAYTLRGFFFLTMQWEPWITSHESALAAARRAGDPFGEALTRNGLGLALMERGRLDEAAEHFTVALDLFDRAGDPHGANNALANRASIRYYRGEYAESLAENERALAFYRNAGSLRNVAITLRSIGLVEIGLGRFPAAIAHFQEALATFTELGLRLDAVMARNCLGEAHERQGAVTDAVEAFQRAAAQARSCGSRYEAARAHHGLGRIAAAGGDHPAARHHLATALADYAALHAPAADDVRRALDRLGPET
jgi:tetratricopeptide (TPR) repeat protein